MSFTIFSLNEQEKISEIIERVERFKDLKINASSPKMQAIITSLLNAQVSLKAFRGNEITAVELGVMLQAVELISRLQATIFSEWDAFSKANPTEKSIFNTIKALA